MLRVPQPLTRETVVLRLFAPSDSSSEPHIEFEAEALSTTPWAEVAADLLPRKTPGAATDISPIPANPGSVPDNVNEGSMAVAAGYKDGESLSPNSDCDNDNA